MTYSSLRRLPISNYVLISSLASPTSQGGMPPRKQSPFLSLHSKPLVRQKGKNSVASRPNEPRPNKKTARLISQASYHTTEPPTRNETGRSQLARCFGLGPECNPLVPRPCRFQLRLSPCCCSHTSSSHRLMAQQRRVVGITTAACASHTPT